MRFVLILMLVSSLLMSCDSGRIGPRKQETNRFVLPPMVSQFAKPEDQTFSSPEHSRFSFGDLDGVSNGGEAEIEVNSFKKSFKYVSCIEHVYELSDGNGVPIGTVQYKDFIATDKGYWGDLSEQIDEFMYVSVSLDPNSPWGSYAGYYNNGVTTFTENVIPIIYGSEISGARFYDNNAIMSSDDGYETECLLFSGSIICN